MRRRARALNCAPWCFTGIETQERGPASDAGPLPSAWNQPRQFDPADAAVKLRSTALLTSSVHARGSLRFEAALSVSMLACLATGPAMRKAYEQPDCNL